MKSLHKKIGAGVLAGVLIIASPIANALLIGRRASRYSYKIATNERQLSVPFLLESQVMKYIKSNPEKIDRNDFNIVVGLQEIYKYRILEVNSDFEGHVINEYNSLGFDSGNHFLRYLTSNEVMEGRYFVQVGKQKFLLHFYEDVDLRMMWWLYLDKWVYLSDSEIKSKGLKINY